MLCPLMLFASMATILAHVHFYIFSADEAIIAILIQQQIERGAGGSTNVNNDDFVFQRTTVVE